MPTHLPKERPAPKPARPGFLSVAFNTFLVVSALALTLVVLMKEQSYFGASSGSAAQIGSVPLQTSSADTQRRLR